MLVRARFVGLMLATAASAAGCGHEDAPREQTLAGTSAIKGGYLDDDDTAAVGIFDLQSGGQCSGSLIAPNLVLTARHCVSNTPQSVQCGQAMPGNPHSASSFFVTTRDRFTNDPDAYHAVIEVVPLPLDPASPDPLINEEDLCGRDQALLILADNIDPAEAIPYTPRVDSSLVAGEEYSAIGFGATNDSGSGSGSRRRRDNLFVDCVADQCPSSYVKESEFIGDEGICSGDSGGPAVDKQNRVVGVTSRGSFGCDDPVYGHVFGWGEWIKETAIHAASLGGYEPPRWALGFSTDPAFQGPVGVACDPSVCISNYCLVDQSGAEYCTAKCDADNPCPEGYECNAELELCQELVPEPEPPPPADDGGAGDGEPATDEDESSCSASGARSPQAPLALLALAAVGVLLRRRH